MNDKQTSHDTEQLQRSRELLRCIAQKMTRRPKFLVVEDDDNDALLLRTELDRFFSRCHILTCCDGQEALDLLADGYRADAVFLDIGLLGMSGFEVMDKIRQKYQYPVVVVTGIPNEERLLAEAMAHGAVYFVAKPITQADLNNIFNKP